MIFIQHQNFPHTFRQIHRRIIRLEVQEEQAHILKSYISVGEQKRKVS